MGGKPRARPRRREDPALADTVMMQTPKPRTGPAASAPAFEATLPAAKTPGPADPQPAFFFGQPISPATPVPRPTAFEASDDRTIELSVTDLEPLEDDDGTA